MPNAWIDALKKWNEGKGMWCLPKKGSKDYEEVKALMAPKAEKPKKEAKAKAPKAEKAEAPLPKIAEKVTREELMSMLESYTEERRRLSSVKGAKLMKGMSRIDKLEGQVKEKIKEMDAAAKPKEKRTIKVSKKVFEPAAPAPKKEAKESSQSKALVDYVYDNQDKLEAIERKFRNRHTYQTPPTKDELLEEVQEWVHEGEINKVKTTELIEHVKSSTPDLWEFISKKSSGEERMKAISEHLKKKDEEIDEKKRKKQSAKARAIIAQRLKEKYGPIPK